MENKIDYENFLAKRIQQLRTQKNVSSYIMSYEIGGGKNYIKNIENAQSYPSWPKFFCICEYLGVTPKEFFDIQNENPGKTREYIDSFQHLNAENRKMLLNLAKTLEKGQA